MWLELTKSGRTLVRHQRHRRQAHEREDWKTWLERFVNSQAVVRFCGPADSHKASFVNWFMWDG